MHAISPSGAVRLGSRGEGAGRADVHTGASEDEGPDRLADQFPCLVSPPADEEVPEAQGAPGTGLVAVRFRCPNCGVRYSQVEEEFDLLAGAVYHCASCGGRVVFRVHGLERDGEIPDIDDGRSERTGSPRAQRGRYRHTVDGDRSRAGRRPKPYPERIDASPEEIADAVLGFRPPERWRYMEWWRRKVRDDRARLAGQRANRQGESHHEDSGGV